MFTDYIESHKIPLKYRVTHKLHVLSEQGINYIILIYTHVLNSNLQITGNSWRLIKKGLHI